MVPSPFGASEMEKPSRLYQHTCRSALQHREEVEVETYLAFARAKLGILQETLSKRKNNV